MSIMVYPGIQKQYFRNYVPELISFRTITAHKEAHKSFLMINDIG